MSVNTFSKRTEADLRSIQLRSILVWTAPKIDLSWIDLRFEIDLRSLWESVHARLDRSLDQSQFAFERSHSDRFGLRSISDRSNSLVWMASNSRACEAGVYIRRKRSTGKHAVFTQKCEWLLMHADSSISISVCIVELLIQVFVSFFSFLWTRRLSEPRPSCESNPQVN